MLKYLKKGRRFILTAFCLKLIALISMFTDHSAFCLYMQGHIGSELYILLRSVGRLAFPIYCFLLVNGFRHSSDRKRYALRLMLFALLSQLPFTLCFCLSNYYSPAPGSLFISRPAPVFWLLALCWAAAYLIFIEKSISGSLTVFFFVLLPGFNMNLGSITLLDGHMNVFYTLSMGLALICLTDAAVRKSLKLPRLISGFILLCAALMLIQPDSDYGIAAPFFILCLYLSRGRLKWICLSTVLWAVLQYGFTGYNVYFTLSAAASLIPIIFYSGRKGPALKYFFYAFYPLHLFLLALSALLPL